MAAAAQGWNVLRIAQDMHIAFGERSNGGSPTGLTSALGVLPTAGKAVPATPDALHVDGISDFNGRLNGKPVP